MTSQAERIGGTMSETDDQGRERLRSRLMHVLELRWEHGTWVYDETALGVYGEPFVLGADTLLTKLRELHVGPGREPFRLVFSARLFPGAIEAQRLREEGEGVWYRAELDGQALEGWLCGHLFDYFAVAPPAIFARGEAAASDS